MATINSYNQNVLNFNQQKTSWENAIHLYKGPDPLEYWYHYCNWYEQNYCYDVTNKMPELLQKVLTQFQNINAYKQDHRLVKVWLKYVEFQQNPLNMFQILYQRGIGTQLSFFYIAWANHYLRENSFKQAESVINWGFQAQAKPLEELQSAQQQVANSYFQFTQRQLTAPYQIVVHQQPATNPQPPLPAQVATNYQNPSYARDKRKLEENFPVQQQQATAKRSRPNEDYTTNAHYGQAVGLSGGSYSQNNIDNQYQYGRATTTAIVENNVPKVVYNNHYAPQQQQYPHQGQAQVAAQHPENGKTWSNHHHHNNSVHPHQSHQSAPPQTVVYHEQQQQQVAAPSPVPQHQQQHYQVIQQPHYQSPSVHQSPNGVVNQQKQNHQPEIIYHQVNPSAVASTSQPEASITTVRNGHTEIASSSTNGYSDLNNSGYVIASSLNYVYDDYHQVESSTTVVATEEVVGLEMETTAATAAAPPEGGIKLPENFSRSAVNNQNFWRAPLYLEEPPDVNRRPMYIKEQVYPVTGQETTTPGRCEYEFSFEELRRNARNLTSLTINQRNGVGEDVLIGTTTEEEEEVVGETYEEYWTTEEVVQEGGGVVVGDEEAEDEYNNHNNVRIVSESSYGAYMGGQEENGGSVYYHVMEPKGYGDAGGGRGKISKSGKKKSKRKSKLIVQINDEEEEEDDDDDEDDEGGGGAESSVEETTIRYTCDQNGGFNGENGIGGGTGTGGSGDVRRITIKLRKQPPSAATTATKVPFGKTIAGGGGGSTSSSSGRNGGNNGYGSGFYRRTATDADADLLLSLGNGQSGYYQEIPSTGQATTTTVHTTVQYNNEDSSSYSEYNASYNSSYLGENSNSGFTSSATATEQHSTPMHSFQHNHHQQQKHGRHNQSISATSTPQLTPAYRRLTKHRSNVSLMNDDSMGSTTMMNENSFFQGELDEEVKGRRLNKALATIEEHLARKSIDPFNAELCKAFLTKIGFPSAELCDVYRMVQQPLPKLSNSKQALLGDTYYNVEKEVGRGTYGAVYKAMNVYTGLTVAVKFQRPANSWELYICNEIKKRIRYHDILPGFMDITSAVMAPNGCVLISEFSPYGSLLDINNKIRQATTRVMHESLVMHFTSQILDIVHYLHSCRIIHADIKPDNFLIMKVPNSSSHVPTVRLIDFGCAIDMTLFPENSQFKKVIQTEGFTCTEMKENRPWTYQTDLYCVAATVHVMLFGEYMQVAKKFSVWDIKQKLPRYLKKHVWVEFFNKLLNIPDCDDLPNLQELKVAIDQEGYAMESELQKHIRTLSNLLMKR